MSKCTEIKEICGDYTFDVEYSKDNVLTMFFNSRRNAETVKRCVEVNDSVPNVATAVDFVEVVRCGKCGQYDRENKTCMRMSVEPEAYGEGIYIQMNENDFCSFGERREE